MSRRKLNKSVPQISKKEERTISKSLSFRSAPIPTVEELQGYENIQEGLASRIVAMAEKQQENRQKKNCKSQKVFRIVKKN